MDPTFIAIIFIVGVFGIVIMWLIAVYNGLVRKRLDFQGAWSQIDVQLKRRHDLIPNLLETVKGYAVHESGTFEAVIKARNAAAGVTSDASHAAEKAGMENLLTQALGQLKVVVEAYPELKANQNFGQLQEELSSTENKIGFARQHFNDCVGNYEEKRQSFPANLVAAPFGFKEQEFFELEDEAIREVPKVSFS